jgi:hypothetical protein
MPHLENIYTYGEIDAFRILGEYSLTEMKVEVRDLSGQHARSAKELEDIKHFLIGGVTWRKIWQRTESDPRGPYVAVGLRCSFQSGK